MANSVDFRDKVLEAVDEARASKSEIARIFGVTRQWIKLLRRRRAEQDGAFAGLRKRGQKPKLGPVEMERLRQLYAEQPDATVEQFHQHLSAELRFWAEELAILDNLAARRQAKVSRLFDAAGIELAFSPPYSPDLNRIENVFSKIKTLLRRAEARTFEALTSAIGCILGQVSASDLVNAVQHAGYGNKVT